MPPSLATPLRIVYTAPDPKILVNGINKTPQRTGDQIHVTVPEEVQTNNFALTPWGLGCPVR